MKAPKLDKQLGALKVVELKNTSLRTSSGSPRDREHRFRSDSVIKLFTSSFKNFKLKEQKEEER